MIKRSEHWEGKAEPRIVCAACACGDVVVIGPRHYDSTMREQIALLGDRWKEEKERQRVIQGFIDQFGDFHTREEAWVIAEKNGQIFRRCGGDTLNGGNLFSENLY